MRRSPAGPIAASGSVLTSRASRIAFAAAEPHSAQLPKVRSRGSPAHLCQSLPCRNDVVFGRGAASSLSLIATRTSAFHESASALANSITAARSSSSKPLTSSPPPGLNSANGGSPQPLGNRFPMSPLRAHQTTRLLAVLR